MRNGQASYQDIKAGNIARFPVVGDGGAALRMTLRKTEQKMGI